MIKTFKKVPNELIIGIILVVCLIFVAISAPAIASFEPTDLTDHVLHPPSSTYLFGTDGIGRDVFSRVVYGTRSSLLVGITAASISMLIGSLVGSIAGYFGSRLDTVITELLNVFSMVPSLFLIILVVSVFGSSIRNVTLVIGLTSWAGTARIMRAQTKSIKERTFVKAARLIGESDGQIIISHIIPHGISPVLVNAATSVSGAIMSEASLSFIGLGDPDVVSWGQIIASGQKYILNSGWIMFFPGLAIAVTLFAFHMIAEGTNKLLRAERART